MTWRPEPKSWQPPQRSRRWFICRGCDTASPSLEAHQAHLRQCVLYGRLIGHDEDAEAARDGGAWLAEMEGKP